MSKTPVPPPAFDASFVQSLVAIFEDSVPFNRVLGFRLTDLQPDGRVTANLDMRPELVGSPMHHRLHGGVISACLDTLGGCAAMAALAGRHPGETAEQLVSRFAKLGTIDLRIDYLRPATGARFELRAEVLRLGSRVASTRMEFLGEGGKLLCAGAAAYIVS